MDSRDSINERGGLQEIIDKALRDMSEEAGRELAPEDVNLAELCRRTGLTRSKARTLKAKGFRVTPHGRCGWKAPRTVLSGHTDALDALLRKGVTNSSVCLDRLRADGYEGGLTAVKDYIRAHRDLVPAKRKVAPPARGRGQRYATEPGEAFQMDWGFVNVERGGETARIACFCMVCHHCGSAHVEFFPNARQECLFIGILHGFGRLGVPSYVLTDNMASVVTRRDSEGRPVWQVDYAAFMEAVGFRTRLCKPRHPYTKGKVERLVRFVKENFLAGRRFVDLEQINAEAEAWCEEQASRYRRALDLVPADEHESRCRPAASELVVTEDVERYLCPERAVSFDGFVSFEGRRYGVPYWYAGRTCRVNREGGVVHVYSADLSRELASHRVDWSRAGDLPCADQYAEAEPAEQPTAPVRVTLEASDGQPLSPLLAKFDFERWA